MIDVGGIPMIQTGGNGDGWGGGGMGAMFAIILIVALLGGGGLFGGRGTGALETNITKDVASGAAFTEINGRLDAIQGQIDHSNDLNELRALYTQACATDMNVTQQAFNVSNLVNQTRTDTLLTAKDAALQLAQCCWNLTAA